MDDLNENVLEGCWVNCEERLPSDNLTKLIRVEHPNLGTVIHLGYFSDGEWHVYYDNNGYIKPVSYWFDGNYFEWLFENKIYGTSDKILQND